MLKDKLLGKSIHHKAFGSGEIIDVINGKSIILSVQFEDECKRFVFPECFEQGFLTTNDDEIKAAIDSLKKKEYDTNGVEEKPQPKVNPPKVTNKVVAKKAEPEKAPPGGWYQYYEDHYPGYVIIQNEKFMYAAHGNSATIMGEVMDYKVHETLEGKLYTGGPDKEKIAAVFKATDVSFLIIEGGRIVESYCGRNLMKNSD